MKLHSMISQNIADELQEVLSTVWLDDIGIKEADADFFDWVVTYAVDIFEQFLYAQYPVQLWGYWVNKN